MKICAFFGHRDAGAEVLDGLEQQVRRAVIERGITVFWHGGCGRFDRMAAETVMKIKKEFPQIRLEMVRAYLRVERQKELALYDDSLYPEGLENVPPRLAISRRNQWMAKKCDLVICLINHPFGGAYSACLEAKRGQKEIWNLGTLEE